MDRCSLVSSGWHYATLHDALWETSVRKLFASFNEQEANCKYYEINKFIVTDFSIDVSRMNKPYGVPLPPPPRLKKIEDYVEMRDGKIISYHTLRKLHIEQGQKKLKSKLKRDRKEYIRVKMQEYYDNMNR